jgi:hypothetical protein
MSRPPPQHNAATTPAFRGPAPSSQWPKTAAEPPRKTKNSVYITLSQLIFQSHVVVKTCDQNPMVCRAGDMLLTPMAWLSGSQNTLKP